MTAAIQHLFNAEGEGFKQKEEKNKVYLLIEETASKNRADGKTLETHADLKAYAANQSAVDGVILQVRTFDSESGLDVDLMLIAKDGAYVHVIAHGRYSREHESQGIALTYGNEDSPVLIDSKLNEKLINAVGAENYDVWRCSFRNSANAFDALDKAYNQVTRGLDYYNKEK